MTSLAVQEKEKEVGKHWTIQSPTAVQNYNARTQCSTRPRETGAFFMNPRRKESHTGISLFAHRALTYLLALHTAWTTTPCHFKGKKNHVIQ